MTTYPNQKIVNITKPKCTDRFLQISDDDWMTACKDLTSSAFALYLYLATNRDGLRFGLSQKDVEQRIGVSKASYHRAVDELINKRYMVCLHGNEYIFGLWPFDEDELVSN